MIWYVMTVVLCVTAGYLLKQYSREKYTKPQAVERIPNERYKKGSELNEDDLLLIETDREMTGIGYYSDEYYYNNILFYNYKV